MRFDLAVSTYYGWSRNKAQQHIRSGLVFLDGTVCTKPSCEVSADATLSLQNDRRINWVSRSAEKLEGFLEHMVPPLTLQNKKALDVGASTGGFTQVLLARAVVGVDAVEIGVGQLHPSLRNDPRVHSYEETDIRTFATKGNIYDIIVCDASFISLHELLPSILLCADTHTDIILLYKPQFEAPKQELSKSGVPKVAKNVAQRMQLFETYIADNHCRIITKKPSTLLGEKGNQEWIYFLKKVG